MKSLRNFLQSIVALVIQPGVDAMFFLNNAIATESYFMLPSGMQVQSLYATSSV